MSLIVELRAVGSSRCIIVIVILPEISSKNRFSWSQDDDLDADGDLHHIISKNGHLHHIRSLHAAVAEDNRIWSSGHRKSEGIRTYNA